MSAGVSHADDSRDRNLVELVADEQPVAFEALAAKEETEKLQGLLADFEGFLKDDIELTKLIGAYKTGSYTPREVATDTTIPAARVSELKRKLAVKLHKFIALRTNAGTSFKQT